MKEDRWRQAHELLDFFYHANQHLWRIGDALWGEGRPAKREEPRLHTMRHGQERKILSEVAR